MTDTSGRQCRRIIINDPEGSDLFFSQVSAQVAMRMLDRHAHLDWHSLCQMIAQSAKNNLRWIEDEESAFGGVELCYADGNGKVLPLCGGEGSVAKLRAIGERMPLIASLWIRLRTGGHWQPLDCDGLDPIAFFDEDGKSVCCMYAEQLEAWIRTTGSNQGKPVCARICSHCWGRGY